ncbi:MAG: hypothetical protein HY321_13660 [Armatimonadetes bacterium]|nr:hypothetical protein [Armatimonadota bacterium]
MEPESRRTLYAIVLTVLTAGSTYLFLGWPRGARTPPAGATAGRGYYPGYHGWYYRRYGGGHGGWMGRGFGWGTFGGLGDGDGIRGGGPGFGK